MKIRLSKQEERAASVPVDRSRVRRPDYGRSLDDFQEGDVYLHPRGLTVDRGLATLFAGTFHEANPLHLNEPFARALGHPTCPVPWQLVFNVVLSLGVQNDSEKAIANLGYYDAHFLRPVYPGDTLRALTRILEKRDRGEGKPGVVTFRTVGIDQHDRPVLQYDRKILVARAKRSAADGGVAAGGATAPRGAPQAWFPEVSEPALELPAPAADAPCNLTGSATWLEEFRVGDVIVHANGRTVGDEHRAWSISLGNTHPLHFDRLYTTSLSGAMSGEPIVYGGLVFAWLHGLASRDATENALAELGFTEGFHTQPVFAGDTLGALSRVLAIEAGVVTFQLIGVKNLRAAEALDRYGAALFEKELTKGTKIAEKVFEIERRVLIRSRGRDGAGAR